MKFLERLQKLSLEKRKIIFFAIVGIIALFLLVCFIIVTGLRMKNFQIDDLKQGLEFPSVSPLHFEIDSVSPQNIQNNQEEF